VTTGLRDLAAMGFDVASNVIAGAMGDLREQVQLSESAEATRLLEQAKAAVPSGVKVETVDRTGRPAAIILDEVEHPEIDTIVLGSRGRGSIARAFFGSVADAVARGSTKPILIARRLVSGPILVALDGSDPSLRAANAAALLAKKLGVGMTLLTVADVPIDDPEGARLAESVRSSTVPFVAQVRKDISQIAPDVVVADRVVVNEAATGILEETGRLGATLIVLGRSGWTRNARLPLGTVVQRVMTHSESSVLVIP
jgi:nucleotide-binding universal stress UspA family protein